MVILVPHLSEHYPDLELTTCTHRALECVNGGWGREQLKALIVLEEDPSLHLESTPGSPQAPTISDLIYFGHPHSVSSCDTY